MLRRNLRRTILYVGTACCLAIVSLGCTPPEPSELGGPVSPSATSGSISPAVTSVPELSPVEEPKVEKPLNETGQFPVQKTEEEWKALLTAEQFQIARLKGTERAFTGQYWNTKAPGTYQCVCCGQDLFVSNAKFDSGCGWPSFFQAVNDTAITTQIDNSIPPPRVEIMCSNCGGHLGHVFKDGPPPTGLRYCVNSASVKLVDPDAEKKRQRGRRQVVRSSGCRYLLVEPPKSETRGEDGSQDTGPVSDSGKASSELNAM